jgi:Phytanoyl-CoA dioxygenase (PhyH)
MAIKGDGRDAGEFAPKRAENAMIMRITPSEAERSARAFSSATLDKASICMRTEGALILEDIVNPALIVEAREIFLQKYDRYLDGQEHDDALEVGDRRLMITLDLEPPFDRRELLANSWLCSVLKAAFGDDFILGAYGVVCSLPGAPRQHIHSDGGDLFPQAALNRMLPIAAATVAIPLLEMNETHGTTALWPGSHRDETRALTEIGDEPLVREGSCLLWDYRLRHGGTPNHSTVPRPLLYMTYCRSWFMDHKNYLKQAPVRAPKRYLADLPKDLRRLLVRAQEC